MLRKIRKVKAPTILAAAKKNQRGSIVFFYWFGWRLTLPLGQTPVAQGPVSDASVTKLSCPNPMSPANCREPQTSRIPHFTAVNSERLQPMGNRKARESGIAATAHLDISTKLARQAKTDVVVFTRCKLTCSPVIQTGEPRESSTAGICGQVMFI